MGLIHCALAVPLAVDFDLLIGKGQVMSFVLRAHSLIHNYNEK